MIKPGLFSGSHLNRASSLTHRCVHVLKCFSCRISSLSSELQSGGKIAKIARRDFKNLAGMLFYTVLLGLVHNSRQCAAAVRLTCFHWTCPINEGNCLPIDADIKGSDWENLCTIDPSLTLTLTYISYTLLPSPFA